MGAKWFCNKCGKEMWTGMSRETKAGITIRFAEDNCFCSDCQLERMRELLISEKEPETKRDTVLDMLKRR